MTDPKVLADSLVEAGMVDRFPDENKEWLYAITMYFPPITAERLITDWRVAGKVLEDWSFNLDDMVSYYDNYEPIVDTEWLRDPTAIIEAWYESR